MAIGIISRRSTMKTMKRLILNSKLFITESNPSINSSLINIVSRSLATSPQPNDFRIDCSATSQICSHRHHWRYFCTGSNATATPTVSQEVKDPSKSSSQGKEGGDSGGKGHNGDNSEQQKQQGKSVRGGPVSWLSFLLLVATGAGLVFYYDREKKKHIQDINTASTAVKQGPSAGKAAIGGPFSLLDHNGKSVTEKDFKGKWTVVYFGFTHCPDICPDELQKLAAAVDKIKKKSGIEIVPIFISVDPERDNVEQVHEYVKEFHPALIGLTGTTDEIKKVARAFRVYYMKTEEEGTDYLVDHSIVMYLMDPNMEFVKFYGKNNDVDSLTDGIINEIKQYKKAKA